jgi:hypothetical protein
LISLLGGSLNTSGRLCQQKEGFQSMFPIGGLNAKTRRVKSCGTAATLDGIPAHFHDDPTKMLVMTYLDQLVGDGFAEWRMLENEEVELRYVTGEVFLLTDTTVTRIT